MIKFDFVVSNLLLLLKCLGFSDISKDVNWINLYSKDGRLLMSAGEKIRIVVDTLLTVDKEIDICVDCKKFIEYVNYIKSFGEDSICSLSLRDGVFQITDDNKNVKNNLYLDYIAETQTKIRAKNFNRLIIMSSETMKNGILFAAIGADASEKYSSQAPSVLIKTSDNVLRIAGTDSVKCCVYTEDVKQAEDSEVIIPTNTARAIASTASLLDKDADMGYSSTYFRCSFGNVAIYSSKVNTSFPPIAPLFDVSGSVAVVPRHTFVNTLRGSTIASRGKQDNRINIFIVDKFLKIHSNNFDASFGLEAPIVGGSTDIPLNSMFLYSLCTLFKESALSLQFSENVIKINNEDNTKVAFVATLK